MKYSYVVFFSGQTYEGQLATGHLDVVRDNIITSGADLQVIEEDIKRLNPVLALVTVTNIQRLPI